MRTTKVLSITLPDAMLKDARRLAKKENRTMSELIREALRRYEAVQRLKDIQAYGAQRASELGIKEEDVDRLIDEARAERRSFLQASNTLDRKAS